ncbi:MAG: serine hydrolase [Patescibacteria group bacterium]
MKEEDKSKRGNMQSLKRWVTSLGILCVMLAATNIWVVTAYVPDKKDGISENAVQQYPLLNPARELYEKNDLIINVQPLRDYLNKTYEADSNVSIYFEYLPTGASIAISKDAEFWPASLLKIPVAMAVAKKIEKGVWRWDNKLVLMAADKDDTFGSLYKEPTGSIFTIEELVKRSLADSDNTANVILLRNLEVKEVTDVYDHIGLSDFLSSDGKISAKRYSVILRSLYNSSYLSEENSQKLISFLTHTPFTEYLAHALPEQVVFAHKIGIDNIKNVYLDSGIVYTHNRPYLLTAMVQSEDEQMAQDIFQGISEKVYTYVSNYREE